MRAWRCCHLQAVSMLFRRKKESLATVNAPAVSNCKHSEHLFPSYSCIIWVLKLSFSNYTVGTVTAFASSCFVMLNVIATTVPTP